MEQEIKDETFSKCAILKNDQNSYFRFYTKMQLNSLFKMFLAIYKSFEEKNERLKKMSPSMKTECGILETEKNKCKKVIEYLYLKIRYILDYPERIKIVSIPINGILQQYKKIEKKSFVDIEWKGFDIEDTWVYGYGMDDENGTMRQVLYISDE